MMLFIFLLHFLSSPVRWKTVGGQHLLQKISTPPHCVLAIEQVLREFITKAKVYPGRPRLGLDVSLGK